MVGIYWGDFSLSNTLFRRDAGALQAYLVDAETAEIKPERTPAYLRHQDLDIMEDNVDGELAALAASGMLSGGFPAHENGMYIRLRYQRLWDEISREEVIGPSESLRIQERIRALNALGFSVGGIEFYKAPQGEQIRLRVLVTDRNFHRDQLMSLTGLEAEEMQARLMMNEIHELRAAPFPGKPTEHAAGCAAYHWMVISNNRSSTPATAD
jgi:hypothetical protein